jgi:hypothetical protein
MTRLLPLPLLLLAPAATFARSDAAAKAEDRGTAEVQADPSNPQYTWGPHGESRLYGLSYIEEDDTDGTRLQGISLLWSSWDETVDFNGGLGFWLAAQDGGSQTIFGGGIEVSWIPWVPRAPVRLGPRFRLGLEHRRRDPDEGYGGLFAAGAEAAFWIGRRLQVALMVDQEIPFRADDRTQVGVALRIARSRY